MSSSSTFDQIRTLQALQAQAKKHKIIVSSGDLSVTITGTSQIHTLEIGKNPDSVKLKQLLNRAITKAQKYNLALLQSIAK